MGTERASTSKVATPYTIDDIAKDILLDTMDEFVAAVVEGGKSLARHRGAQNITLGDVQLVLGMYRPNEN